MDGHLTAWLARGLRTLLVWLPEHEPDRSRHAEALARVLPMTEAREGFAAMAGGDVFGKVVFTR